MSSHTNAHPESHILHPGERTSSALNVGSSIPTVIPLGVFSTNLLETVISSAQPLHASAVNHGYLADIRSHAVPQPLQGN